MKDSIFHKTDLKTPAYVYDQTAMLAVLARLNELKKATACKILYSIKSANIKGLLEVIKSHVDGFSCSSLFELKLAKQILKPEQTTHITTPGYRDDEWAEIIHLSSHITLNSIRQWRSYATQVAQASSCGIRINPELSFVKDERYDPCRADSKLGMTFEQIATANKEEKLDWSMIEGIHIHNNCESNDLTQLEKSIKQVMHGLNEYKPNLKWINLGGGYLFDESSDISGLVNTINELKKEFQCDLYLEPGKAVTGHAGYLVASVVDLIETKNKTIAVLDSTINHLPEVFEYQYQPKVMGAVEGGEYKYRLAGASCLSGDLFGDYTFNKSLEIGSRIIFENIGAYMQVKANMFNGINLPASYLLTSSRKIELIRQCNFEHFCHYL